MKEIKEVFVIHNPSKGTYHSGYGFTPIRYAKEYVDRETALSDMIDILKAKSILTTTTESIQYLKIEKFYKYN